MACLLLALAGPAQSWGTSSRFEIRDAGTEPSKSGVIGMLASALGRPRNASISDLAGLRMGVRVDTEGTVQRDYQTAQGAIRADGTRNPDAVTSYRHFLADAAFLVVLEGESALIGELEMALTSPRWPLFLGRKAFPPAGPVLRGVCDATLQEVLAGGTWTDPSRRRTGGLRQRLKNGERVTLRTIMDAEPGDATDFRDDVPVSFEPRRFTRRAVVAGVVPLTLDMLPPLAEES
ncbi:MAG: type I-E CRISPR-associated protein Cas5/CasD [Acidimicrobiales bacterium]